MYHIGKLNQESCFDTPLCYSDIDTPAHCKTPSRLYIMECLYVWIIDCFLGYSIQYVIGSKSFRPDIRTKTAPNGKCCDGYIVPSMVRLMYQLKSVLKKRETMLKNSKFVLFLSPYKVGQAGNFWTLPRTDKMQWPARSLNDLKLILSFEGPCAHTC